MNSDFLLERAKYRRRLAATALRRTAAKREMTPDEVQKALQKTDKLQSIFGAPNDTNGNPVGKAGRTISLMEKWLKAKGEHGLPPLGEQFKTFVTQEMDGSNYIWGHEEAVRDLSRDIHYNFGFDPDQVSLVETKDEPAVPPQTADMGHMAPMVQPIENGLTMSTSGSVKGFTKESQYAYPPSERDDHTVLPETPVVTRVDYEEDIEKAKELSEFAKKPVWTFNQRDVGKNNTLDEKSSSEMRRDPPASTLDEEEQYDDYKKPDNLYPVRGFANKPAIRSFAQIDMQDYSRRLDEALRLGREKINQMPEVNTSHSVRVLELPVELENALHAGNVKILADVLDLTNEDGSYREASSQKKK